MRRRRLGCRADAQEGDPSRPGLPAGPCCGCCGAVPPGRCAVWGPGAPRQAWVRAARPGLGVTRLSVPRCSWPASWHSAAARPTPCPRLPDPPEPETPPPGRLRAAAGRGGGGCWPVPRTLAGSEWVELWGSGPVSCSNLGSPPKSQKEPPSLRRGGCFSRVFWLWGRRGGPQTWVQPVL